MFKLRKGTQGLEQQSSGAPACQRALSAGSVMRRMPAYHTQSAHGLFRTRKEAEAMRSGTYMNSPRDANARHGLTRSTKSSYQFTHNNHTKADDRVAPKRGGHSHSDNAMHAAECQRNDSQLLTQPQNAHRTQRRQLAADARAISNHMQTKKASSSTTSDCSHPRTRTRRVGSEEAQAATWTSV
jgi:hypothetical protein